MGKHPVKLGKRELRNVDREAVEVIDSDHKPNPFFSFQYSYTEISSTGGKGHVKSRKTRFEDGKLTSEAFEGEFDHSTYERIVGHAQQYFLNQAALFLKSLSLFLPFSQSRPPDRD